MNLLAIDPGYADPGNACALFNRGRLVWVDFLPTCAPALFQSLETVVIEKPQMDARSRSIPPKILINLAWSGALLAGAHVGRYGADLVAYTPSEWKGSVSKPVHHRHLWRVLDDAERAVLGGDPTWAAIEVACEKRARKRGGIPGAACYKSTEKVHNLLDAAGLGCYHLGRMPTVYDSNTPPHTGLDRDAMIAELRRSRR